MGRVDERIRLDHSARGTHETLEQFQLHRRRFLSLRAVFPLMHVVGSGVTPEEVHARIVRAVVKDTPALGDMVGKDPDD